MQIVPSPLRELDYGDFEQECITCHHQSTPNHHPHLPPKYLCMFYWALTSLKCWKLWHHLILARALRDRNYHQFSDPRVPVFKASRNHNGMLTTWEACLFHFKYHVSNECSREIITFQCDNICILSHEPPNEVLPLLWNPHIPPLKEQLLNYFSYFAYFCMQSHHGNGCFKLLFVHSFSLSSTSTSCFIQYGIIGFFFHVRKRILWQTLRLSLRIIAKNWYTLSDLTTDEVHLQKLEF